jgi:hypothetical protein
MTTYKFTDANQSLDFKNTPQVDDGGWAMTIDSVQKQNQASPSTKILDSKTASPYTILAKLANLSRPDLTAIGFCVGCWDAGMGYV